MGKADNIPEMIEAMLSADIFLFSSSPLLLLLLALLLLLLLSPSSSPRESVRVLAGLMPG